MKYSAESWRCCCCCGCLTFSGRFRRTRNEASAGAKHGVTDIRVAHVRAAVGAAPGPGHAGRDEGEEDKEADQGH